MRVKSRWHKKDRPKSAEDIGSALGFIAWRIAANAVDNMEKAGFGLRSYAIRLDVIAAFLAFLVHVADRLAYGSMDEAERRRLITRMGLRLADTMAENKMELLGAGEYRQAFIDTLNGRVEEYSELAFTEEGPAYGFLRLLGEQVRACAQGDDTRWILEQVVDIEAPEAVKTLTKAFADLRR
jgi:hypothetical protein